MHYSYETPGAVLMILCGVLLVAAACAVCYLVARWMRRRSDRARLELDAWPQHSRPAPSPGASDRGSHEHRALALAVQDMEARLGQRVVNELARVLDGLTESVRDLADSNPPAVEGALASQGRTLETLVETTGENAAAGEQSLRELAEAVHEVREGVARLVERKDHESEWERALVKIVDDGIQGEEARRALTLLPGCAGDGDGGAGSGGTAPLTLLLAGHLLVLSAGALSDRTHRSDAFSVLSRIGAVAAAMGADGANEQWAELFDQVEKVARRSFGIRVKVVLPRRGGLFDPDKHERVEGAGQRVADVLDCGLLDTDARTVIRKALVATSRDSSVTS